MNWKLWLALVLVGWVVILDKKTMSGVLNKSLPPKEASLMAGIVLGEQGGISKADRNDLKRSGLIHVVVASGGNILLIVGGFVEGLARFVGRKKSILLGMVVGWKYVSIVGWDIPVLRAMLLISLVYLAQLLGRKYDIGRGIIGASLIMILGEPRVVFSISFWLSISAFVGVILFVKPEQKYNRGWLEWVKVRVWEMVGETVIVTLWILPIISMVFGEVSLVAPLANLLAVWQIQLVTLVGLVGTLSGVVIEDLGRVVLWLTIPMLRYLSEISRVFSLMPGWKVGFNWWMLCGYYLFLIGWRMRIRNESK